jgi:hypothetical protein
MNERKERKKEGKERNKGEGGHKREKSNLIKNNVFAKRFLWS